MATMVTRAPASNNPISLALPTAINLAALLLTLRRPEAGQSRRL